LEKLFEGFFVKAFGGGVHPLEIARRLVREADDARVLGMGETLAPNSYQVFLSAVDFRRLEGFLDGLGAEMETMIITHANQKGYHLLTRPRVEFSLDEGLGEGEFVVRASLEEPSGKPPREVSLGKEPKLSSPAGGVGVLTVLKGDKAGTAFRLRAGKTKIGRSVDNDVILADPRVSRYHAEIDRLPEGYVVRDLGSTNGTVVGGRRIRERLLEDGDILVMGETEMRFGLEGDRGNH
jgi:hypothetical protein